MRETPYPLSLPLFALLVLLIGAGIYLPGLGTPELRGEEPRRALPARDMLQTGDWVVPEFAGKPYSRKPPLVNWAVAVSTKLTGQQNEFTARLPSTIAVLGTSLALLLLGAPLIGQMGAFAAAILFLISKSILDKGHTIEIEALYTFAFGVAWLWWLRFDKTAQPWAAWIGAGLFLGVGLLAKGPLHLIFFFALFFSMEGRNGIKKLLRWPPLLGFTLCFGPFFAWAILNQSLNPAGNSSNVWLEQLTDRIGLNDFKFSAWITNIPNILLDFMPSTLFIPLILKGIKLNTDKPTSETSTTFRRLLITIGICVTVIGLGPSLRPRFAMPLIVPTCFLAGWALSLPGSFTWMARWRKTLILTSSALLLTLLVAPAFPQIGVTSNNLALLAITTIIILTIIWKQLIKKSASLPTNLIGSGFVGILCWQVYLHVLWPLQRPKEVFRPVAAAIIQEIQNNRSPFTWPTKPGDIPSVYAIGMREQPFLYYLGPDCHERATFRDFPEKPPVILLHAKDWIKLSKTIVNKYGPPKRRKIAQTSHFRSKWKLQPIMILTWKTRTENLQFSH